MSFALMDVNSFYASCESVFRPDTRGKPVVVLSNNDGCAIAYNKEAKKIGFGQMCEPYFQIKERIRKHKVFVFSSNYSLYDNMSRRVMSILRNYSPEVEIYSVDEAFLHYEGFHGKDFLEEAKKIRKDILQQTGLPVGVGFAPTKVLAKVANKLAKKGTGTFVLETEGEIDEALEKYPVQDIWGIGRKSASKLQLLGIRTALEFKNYRDEKMVQKLLTKTGREVQDELRGISCLPMEDAEAMDHTGTSRSFSTPVFEKRELREALAHFATHAALKLRQQEGVCFSVSIFIHTNSFRPGEQYYGEGSFPFTTGTSDTLKIIRAAHQILDGIYRPGLEYKKAGVMLNHIIPRNQNQMDLFSTDPSDNEKLIGVMDEINRKYGAYTIKSAACGINPLWKTLAAFKSPKYTTDWNQLLKIKVKDSE